MSALNGDGPTEAITWMNGEGEQSTFIFPEGVLVFCNKTGFDLLCVEEGDLHGWKSGTAEWVPIPDPTKGTLSPFTLVKKPQ